MHLLGVLYLVGIIEHMYNTQLYITRNTAFSVLKQSSVCSHFLEEGRFTLYHIVKDLPPHVTLHLYRCSTITPLAVKVVWRAFPYFLTSHNYHGGRK